ETTLWSSPVTDDQTPSMLIEFTSMEGQVFADLLVDSCLKHFLCARFEQAGDRVLIG
ncbi:MAG: hypothetical protein GY930_11350, partial [bacterium]|nr:hypothetical protein [bacterium]